MGSGQSVTDAATVVGAAAGVGSLAVALFYPVIAVQMRNRKYKEGSKIIRWSNNFIIMKGSTKIFDLP